MDVVSLQNALGSIEFQKCSAVVCCAVFFDQKRASESEATMTGKEAIEGRCACRCDGSTIDRGWLDTWKLRFGWRL